MEKFGDVSVFMKQAREEAGSCWSDERVEDRAMDDELAEVMAEKIAEWMQKAAHNREAAYLLERLIRSDMIETYIEELTRPH